MKLFLIILLIFLVLLLLLFVTGIIMFKFSLDTKSVFYLPAITGKKPKSEEDIQHEKKRTEMDEYIRSNSSDVFIQSFDGLKLCANFWKAENSDSNRYVILCHGYNGSPAEMLKIGLHYLENGFNLIFVNERCYGKSQGRYCTMSVNESKDVKSWVEFILTQNSTAQIVLHGISMGAASVMKASALNLPSNVKFIAEDCGFTSIWEEYSDLCKKLFHLPAFPLLNFASLAARLLAHFSYHQGNCLKAVKICTIPMLFAHGTSDEVVPFKMQNKLYEAASCPKALIVAEGAKHTKSCHVNPELYFQKLDDFIQSYIE